MFVDVWSTVRDFIPKRYRVEVCSEIIRSLQQHDWDQAGDFLNDEEWPEFNEAYELAKKPRNLEDEEDDE